MDNSKQKEKLDYLKDKLRRKYSQYMLYAPNHWKKELLRMEISMLTTQIKDQELRIEEENS